MIKYYVGSIGSGKTSFAVNEALKCLKNKKLRSRYKYIFSNIESKIVNKLDMSLLASKVPPDNALILIDESGIEFNSREFKSLSKGIIEFFKMSRHYNCDINLYSQTFDDTDKMLRDLAEEIWLIKKFGPVSFARCVWVRIGIGEDSHKLEYQHYFKSILLQLLPFQKKQFEFCFRPLCYKYFDSWTKLDRNVFEIPFKSVDETRYSVFK